uniref:Uncharacterized protein n=1 Tax=Avena sativa TaxID=4498 RepID=A0ACD5TTN5_AVESA
MFKVTLILQAIALCFFFHALRTRGVQLRPTIQKFKENYSDLHDFVHGSTKQNPKSLNSSSIAAMTFGQDPSTWDKPFFALHLTSYGGPNDNYYGLHTTMGVYNHKLTPGQWSGAAIWVYHDGDGVESSFNSIHVGWHIHPERYGDSHPHFYTVWTRDGHVTTGCINMDCADFVRANGSVIAPGDAIQVSDVPDGHIPNITLRVPKDQTSGDWWVYYGLNSVPTGVGYFPRSSFTYLADKAKQMAFGGAVVSIRADPTPPMGSGFLPNDGLGRAASFTDLRIIDRDGSSKPILVDLLKFVTDEKCHSIAPIHNGTFLYGGPGNCVR